MKGLQFPLLPFLVLAHHHIVSLGDPIHVPWEDAQLVATQVANNKVRVRGGAMEHVAQQVMQIKISGVVCPSSYGHLKVASAAPLVAVAMWLQPEPPLELDAIQKAIAISRGHHTAGQKVWVGWVDWHACTIPIICP